MSPSEYQAFNTALQDARNCMVDREQAVSAVFETGERGLTVLGATAVEDRLQDGVPHTLEALRAAGIKVWVLTGDKHETAINISYSCGHIKRGMTSLNLIHQASTQECLCTLQEISARFAAEPLGNYALIVDGLSLTFALAEHKELFSKIARTCHAVLCCRMSPLQKAQVVNMIKNHPSQPITAAIGDGANDVSMIQEAHVGLGIMGKEGRQAVRCSDFAFARFRFLQRVFLVHGHYYYVRVANLVQYFFYKNVAFITPQVIFTFFSAFSGQPLYHSIYLMFFNLFFSSLPILIYGLLEQNIPQATLLARPDLYKLNARNSLLTKSQFAKWLLQGFYHSLVIFFGVYLCWNEDVTLQSGQVLDILCFGTTMFQTVVFVVNFKLMLHTHYLTAASLIGIAISVLGFEAFSFLYSSFMWPYQDNYMYDVFIKMAASPTIWFIFILLFFTSLIPDVIALMMESNVGKIGRILRSVKPSCLKPSSNNNNMSLHYSSRPPDVTVFHISVNPERSF